MTTAGVRAPEKLPANLFAANQSFVAEWPPMRDSWYAVVGITPSRSQDCLQAEPVIKATHLLPLITVCFEVATLLLGAAKADAQTAREIAIVAHRIDQPHKPRGFVTVVMTQESAFFAPKARRLLGPIPVAKNVPDEAGPGAPAPHCCGCRRRRQAFRKQPLPSPIWRQLPIIGRH
jgi:hypothetical protein